MFKWLKGRKNLVAVKSVEYEDLQGQSLEAVESTLQGLVQQPAAFTVNSGQAISRRLIDIACFDEGVDPQLRERALMLESALWKSVEDALQSQPEDLKIRREAREMHLEHGRQAGVFSLMHKIKQVPSDRVVSEIISLKNAALLENFPKDGLSNQREYVIRELLRDRALREITQVSAQDEGWLVSSLRLSNAVVTAGWLVLIRDPTAVWAFTTEERLSLGKYLDDYERGRTKLISLGVIETGASVSLSPPPEPRLLHDLLVQSAGEGRTREAVGKDERYRARLASLSEDGRASFMTVIFCLRIFLWKKTLSSVYGTEFASTVMGANPEARWPQSIRPVFTKLEFLYDRALMDESPSAGFHNLIVASETLDFLDESLPSEEKNRVVQHFADILKSELFHFPQNIRYLLRFALRGEPEVQAAMSEDALDR